MKNIIVAEELQPWQLREALEKGGISHAAEGIVSIPFVEVKRTKEGEKAPFFCLVQGVDIIQISHPGDGGPLPNEIVIHGLDVKKMSEGICELTNIRFRSNGKIELFVSEDSKPVSESEKGFFARLFGVLSLSG